MTRHEIFLNYSQAMKQADRLDEVAQRIEKLVGEKIERTTDALKAAWQSDNSPQYIWKVKGVQKEISGNAKEIRKVAQNIRSAAEEMKRAELRALEIAERRSYR